MRPSDSERMHFLSIALSLLTASYSPPTWHCELPARSAHQRWSRAAPPRPRAVAGQRQLTDGLGALPGLFTSERIAVHWGDLGPGATEAQITDLAHELEAIADAYIQAGYWAHNGAEAYYLNVYLANTGGAAPSVSFLGAFVWTDDEGYPYMAINPEVLAQTYPSDYRRELLAHEFFHVLQLSTDAFADAFQSEGWFFESSASWASEIVVGDDRPLALGQAPLALLTPQYPVDYYAFDATGAAAGRWYGMWLLSDYLATHGYPLLMRDVWLTSGPGDDVLAAHDRLLASYDGSTLANHLGDYAVSNVTRAYQHAAEIEAFTGSLAKKFNIPSETIAAEVAGDERTPSIVEGTDAPGGYGYAVVRWLTPSDTSIVARVAGVDGAPLTAPLDARLIISTATSSESVPLVLEDGALFVAASLPMGTTAVRLVVAALPAQWTQDQRFAFSYFLGGAERDPLSDASEASGCRSSGVSSSGMIGLVVALVALLFARSPRNRLAVAKEAAARAVRG